MKTKNYFFIILILSLIISLVLSSCSSSARVSNVIPYETQQLIKTAKAESISYNYLPNPKGDIIEVGSTSYSINSPFKALIDELMQTKFQSISANSSDNIEIYLTDVKPEFLTPAFSAPSHTLGLTVELKLTKDGEVNEKRFAFSTEAKVTQPGFSTAVDTKPIHELLMKFIISIDKFIDTNYDVQ